MSRKYYWETYSDRNGNLLRFWPFPRVGLDFVLLITVDASAEFPLVTCLGLCQVLSFNVYSRRWLIFFFLLRRRGRLRFRLDLSDWYRFILSDGCGL